MMRGNGFRLSLQEALAMTVAAMDGWLRLRSMLMPGGHYLVLLPGEDSYEMCYIREHYLTKEWIDSVREGGPPYVVIESFLDRVRPDVCEEDRAILLGIEPVNGLKGVSDMDLGAMRSLEAIETLN